MTTGVLPWDQMTKALNLNTGFFETSQLTLDKQMRVIAGNWDGAGMSAGNMQYNWGTADRLTELFNHMFNNYESVVQGAFGADTTRFNEFKTVCTTYTRTQKISWGGTITDPNNGHTIIEPWLTYIGNLLVTPECYAKYVQMMDTYYLQNALEVFRQLSCKSRLALASLFDISVNKGRYYPVNSIQADFDEIDANVGLTEAQKETQKIYQINFRGNEEENALNDASSTTFWPRRGCMANIGGDYFGSPYEPEVNFDMNLEPALAEKADSIVTDPIIKLGEISVQDIFLGTTPITSLYLGANLLGGATEPPPPYTTNTVPQTQFRTNPNSYAGIGAVSTLDLTAGQPLWVDVQNYVACRTYYTIDGTTPTTGSTKLKGALTFSESCTLKTFSISVNGIGEAVKTLTVNVAGASVTTISPSAVTQNTIPFTVTLTNNQGATIYYKLGATGTQQTYTVPFPVSQDTPGVYDSQILVTYWSTGETEKTITYDTSGAIPGKTVVTTIPGNYYVRVNWTPTANTTSYNLYRSTVPGTLGDLLVQYQPDVGYDDGAVDNDVTYYYTVKSANYANNIDSDQVPATPTGAPVTSTYRYVRFVGYGDNTSTTTRLVEIQALEGATNRLLNKVPGTYPAPNAGTIGVATDGAKVQSSGYPLWWSGAGIPDMYYDMGALYPIDTINVTGYSSAVDPRQTKFKVYVSKDASAWTLVQDYSLNTTPQPVTGFDFTVT